MINFTQLAIADITENKQIVVSLKNDNGYTIAQRLNYKDNETGERMTPFIKGGIHIPNIESLVKFRDALDCAISLTKDLQRIEWDGEESEE